MLGSEPSAFAVAQAMGSGAEVVDTVAALATAKLELLDFSLQAEQTVWQLVQHESNEARKASRTPFCYIDFTSPCG